MAPVAHGLAALGCRPTLVLTGQHPHLPLGDLDLKSSLRCALNCPGKAYPHNHVRRVTAGMTESLEKSPTCWSSRATALPRSELPWPVSWRACPLRMSRLAFGRTTRTCRGRRSISRRDRHARRPAVRAYGDCRQANLRTEQVPGEVHVTGNTGIDSLFAVQAKLPPRDASRRRRAAAAGDLSSPRKLGRWIRVDLPGACRDRS